MQISSGTSQPEDPIDALMEARTWSPFRITLLLICFSATLMDGVHVQTMGVVAPAVARDIPMSNTGLGFLMAASEFGFMLGALLLSPVTDRFGRKRMLVLSTVLFALTSVGTSYATSLPAMLTARLLTGFGLGCAGPAVVSLAAEYTPVRQRARIATLVWAANPAGSFAAGVLGSMIVPDHGWRGLFLAAGLLTLVFALLIAAFVPESLRFLLLRAPGDRRIPAILKGLGAESAPRRSAAGAADQGRAGAGVPLRLLFEGDNASFTPALWAAFFLCFMCLLAILTWTVSILSMAGLGIATSSMVIAFNNVGGTVGVATAGWAMERLGGARLLVATFALGALAILGMSASLSALPLLLASSAFAGLFVGGNTAGLIALAAQRYPTLVRATGIGWGLAVARLGGTLGPILMGVVAETGAAPATLLGAIAIPSVLAAVVALTLCRRKGADLRTEPGRLAAE